MPKLRKFPDLRKRFKVGNRVCYTYHYPGEEKKKYCGTVKVVTSDALDVKIDGLSRLSRFWDYAVYAGGGPYSTPLKKIRKRRR